MAENHVDDEIELVAIDTVGATVNLHGQTRAVYGERFMTLFPAALVALGRLKRSDAYWRVMVWAMTRLDPIQYRPAIQREIAKDTGLSLRSVERGLTMLRKDNVLIEHHAQEGHPQYRLSINLCWASTARKRNRIIADDGDDPVLGVAS